MFSPQSILNLIGQLGGNHQQAAQQMQGMGLQNGQIDPNQHAGFLSRFGINPQQLQQGGYLQHFQAQRQGNFQGYGYDQQGFAGSYGQQDQYPGEYQQDGDFQQGDQFQGGNDQGGQYEDGGQDDQFQGGDE